LILLAPTLTLPRWVGLDTHMTQGLFKQLESSPSFLT